MEKLTKKMRDELKVNLKSIEAVLNDKEQWQIQNGCYNYELWLDSKRNRIDFDIFNEDEEYYGFQISLDELEDVQVKTICKAIINTIYCNEINRRQRFVKDNKNFQNRKVKSLTLWSERKNNKRVKQIEEDLIYHYQEIQRCKNELEEFKTYCRDIYRVMWTLVPDWKVEDISTYCKEKFTKFNVQGVHLFTEENKIVAKYRGYKVSANVDSFSRNDDVFRILNLKIKMIQELEAYA